MSSYEVNNNGEGRAVKVGKGGGRGGGRDATLCLSQARLKRFVWPYLADIALNRKKMHQ